jgi:hypothetical protein
MWKLLEFLLLIPNLAYSEPYVKQIVNSKHWQSVYATRIGLVGNTTASGEIVDSEDVFVALPHKQALGKTIVLKYGDKTVVCEVLDVGPHSIRDDYWQHSRRPLAEQGRRLPSRWGRAKNKAGIDLSDGLWALLGLDNKLGMIKVSWKFVS